jgi:hypothetical protein
MGKHTGISVTPEGAVVKHWNRKGKYHGLNLEARPPQLRWTPESNARLLEAVKKYGTNKSWRKIAEYMGDGKEASVCYQHYFRVVNPDICREKFSREELLLVVALIRRHGSSEWTKLSRIVSRVTGRLRTPTQMRSRWVDIRAQRNPGAIALWQLIQESTPFEVLFSEGLTDALWQRALEVENEIAIEDANREKDDEFGELDDSADGSMSHTSSRKGSSMMVDLPSAEDQHQAGEAQHEDVDAAQLLLALATQADHEEEGAEGLLASENTKEKELGKGKRKRNPSQAAAASKSSSSSAKREVKHMPVRKSSLLVYTGPSASESAV